MASTGRVIPVGSALFRDDATQSIASRNSQRPPLPFDWNRRRVTVMGLGRHGGGVAVARHLVEHGAIVTISDAASRKALGESLGQLSDVPIAACHLGGHDPRDFTEADFVIVNPAVRFDHPLLRFAQAAGATLTSEIEIFLRACPAEVIGVTGSNGKSTTSSMIAGILSAAGRRTWLGGNIGRSLLGEVRDMRARDWVVLELSSFQLAHLSHDAPLPRFAVVTNCTPNHLDWHDDFPNYIQAKQRVVRETPADAVVVLNGADVEVSGWRGLAAGSVRGGWASARVPALRVPGEHNRQNAACAAAVAEAAGVDEATICRALADFQGLEHRLQWVGEVAGRRFYNDSKSTTTASTLAALSAIAGPVWLLAGGHAKGASFDELAGAIVGRARGASLFGAASGVILDAIQAQQVDFDVHDTEQLADALAWCWRRSQPGDSILLSPACASYDQFRDFEARGHAFRGLVESLRSTCGDLPHIDRELPHALRPLKGLG
jgi:UDP-N-acetylmuramoylalanine--D-glutamate ligase